MSDTISATMAKLLEYPLIIGNDSGDIQVNLEGLVGKRLQNVEQITTLILNALIKTHFDLVLKTLLSLTLLCSSQTKLNAWRKKVFLLLFLKRIARKFILDKSNDVLLQPNKEIVERHLNAISMARFISKCHILQIFGNLSMSWQEAGWIFDTLLHTATTIFWIQPITINNPNSPLTWKECYIAYRKCGLTVDNALALMQRSQKVSPLLPNINQLVAFSCNYLFGNRVRLNSKLEPFLLNELAAQMSLDGMINPSPLTVICYWKRHVSKIFGRYYRCLAETFAGLLDFDIPDWLCRDALHYPYPSMEQFYFAVSGQVFWSVGQQSYRVHMHLPFLSFQTKNLFWFPPSTAMYRWSCPDLPNIAPQDNVELLGKEIGQEVCKRTSTEPLLNTQNLYFESINETLLSYVRPVALSCISELLNSKYKAVCAHVNESDRRFEIFFDSQQQADDFSCTHPGVDSQIFVEPILVDL